MNLSYVTFFLLFFTFQAQAVIYGENTIVEVEDLTDSREIKQAQAVAGVFTYFPEHGINLNRIGNSRKLMHKMVCEDESFYQQPIESVATAFLITEKHVMTVGHAVTSKQDCREKIFFSFNYEWRAQEQNIVQLKNEDIYLCKDIIEFSYTGIDYAIIELDRKVPNITPLELDLEYDASDFEAIYTIGHPLQLPKKKAQGHLRAQFPQDSHYYTAEIDTFRGNSGSPIFSERTGKVIGILKDGESDFTLDEGRFCQMFKLCPEDGVTCRGESITRLDKIPKSFFRE